MKYILVFVLGIIVSFCGFLANYLGVFKPVVISQQSRGPYVMVYKDHVGPYHKTVSVITEVETWIYDKGLDCHLSFGEYPDDPEKTEEARLKSRGGCLLDSLSPEVAKQLPPDFKVAEKPAQPYVVAVFEGSPGIGPMKVYPKIADYMKTHGLQQKGAVIEIYEIHSRTENNSMTTTYLFGYAVTFPDAAHPGK